MDMVLLRCLPGVFWIALCIEFVSAVALCILIPKQGSYYPSIVEALSDKRKLRALLCHNHVSLGVSESRHPSSHLDAFHATEINVGCLGHSS
jgi:hypothetical protein